MCGVIQLTVDILIIIQIVLYSKENYLEINKDNTDSVTTRA